MEMDCERSRGRCDASIQSATENKAPYSPFTPKIPLLLFGLTESTCPGEIPLTQAIAVVSRIHCRLKKMEQVALMGGVLQQVAPVDGETLLYPPLVMWSEVACLLEDLAPPHAWGEVEVMPEAVEGAL